MVKLYTTDNCEACTATIKWLEDRGIRYEIINLGDYE
jgi:arsenate reductase-like glutaredoxin family protein